MQNRIEYYSILQKEILCWDRRKKSRMFRRFSEKGAPRLKVAKATLHPLI
jgi:hypothetical protein